MKVCVVIATHGRVEITTTNIKNLLLQKPKPSIVVMCSEQAELEYYKSFDVTVALEPNRPLGRKWQVGVNIARKMNPDALVILGSDDLLHDYYLRTALSKINQGYEFVGTTHWYNYDVKRNEVMHCNYVGMNKDFPIGSGKVYSKKVLDSIGWKLFDTNADRKLDDRGHKQMTLSHAKMFLIQEPMILAVKGKWPVMNSSDAYKQSRNIASRQADKEVLKKFHV
jgi:hypothetical protein